VNRRYWRTFGKTCRFVRLLGTGGFLSGLLVALASGCGEESALVGGECASGYVERDGRCSRPGEGTAFDAGSGEASARAEWAGPADSSVSSNASLNDALPHSSTASDADGSSHLVDGGAIDSGPGDRDGGTLDSSSNGEGGQASQDPQGGHDAQSPDAASDVCGMGCKPLCDAPLVACDGICVDTQSDPENCGICGRVCASNICIAGRCQGATTGDIVYIGHDYIATPVIASQAQVLSRSVLLAVRNPVRVRLFTRDADPSAVARLNAILAAIPATYGRNVTVDATTSEVDVSAGLAGSNFDVLLVPDLVTATAGVPASLGAGWASDLASFTHRGGVFIVLDGAAGPLKEMPEFIRATGLLDVTSHSSLGAGSVLDVVAPWDAVGTGVVAPYAGRKNSVLFDSEPSAGRVVWVVRDPVTAKPNVVHKAAL